MENHYFTTFCVQSFVVSLVNPRDGAVIGDMNSVVVTINKNDDINGVFSFENVLVSYLEVVLCTNLFHVLYIFLLGSVARK